MSKKAWWVAGVLVLSVAAGSISLSLATRADARSDKTKEDFLRVYEQERQNAPNNPAPSDRTPPKPMAELPQWAKTIRRIEADPPGSRNYGSSPVFKGLSSNWQVGTIPAYNNTLWNEFYVWTRAANDGTEWIGTTLLNAPPEQRNVYNQMFRCPRGGLGELVITGATGPTGQVTFRSKSGVTGSFDLTTHTWSFDN